MDLLKLASNKVGICLYRNRHGAVHTSTCVHILISVAEQPHLSHGHLIFVVPISHTDRHKHTHIQVLNSGTCRGLNGWIPTGGQVDPNSIVGDSLEWKNAQKNDTKNKTSYTRQR
jgi:hypothetical protein